MTIDIHETWSVNEACKHLNISRATLWRIVNQHGLEAFSDARDLRKKRFRRKDVEAVVARAYRFAERRQAA